MQKIAQSQYLKKNIKKIIQINIFYSSLSTNLSKNVLMYVSITISQ